MPKKVKRYPQNSVNNILQNLPMTTTATLPTKTLTISMNEFQKSVQTIVPGQDMIAKSYMQIISKPGGEHVYKRQAELVKEYNQILVDKKLALRRSELKKLDLINMTAIIDNPDTDPASIPVAEIFNDKAYINYLQQSNTMQIFCHMIPPFTTGVLQINRDRYVHFDVQKIDMQNRTIDIWLHDYGVYDGIWSPGVSGRIQTRVDDDTYVTLNTNPSELTLFTDLYRKLDYKKDLHWSDNDISIWEKVVITYSSSTERIFKENDTNNVQEMARIVFKYFVLLNYFLMRHKPKAIRKPKAKKSANSTVPDNEPTQTSEPVKPEQPDRLVRMVGIISVTSTKIPRESTERSVSKYKIAVWKARGGIRRMKDGRLIPFKESIRHRKALMTDDDTVPQSIIQVKDNRVIKPNKS